MKKLDYLVFILFAVLLFALVLSHAPWRDEAQSWLIARDVQSLSEFIRIMRYEGSPPLWHLLLMPFAKLGAPYVVQSLLNAAIVAATAFIMIWKAPFSKVFAYAFPFGCYLLLEYGTIARSYGMTALLLFAVAALYSKRFSHWGAYLFLIFLLGSTNFFGLALAGGLTLHAAIEGWSSKSAHLQKRFLSSLCTGFALFCMFILLIPPRDIAIVTDSSFATSIASIAFPIAALGVGFFPISTAPFYVRIFSFSSFVQPFIIGCAVFIALCSTVKSRKTLLLFLCTLGFLMAFFAIMHFGAARHLGLLYIASIAYIWMRYADTAVPAVLKSALEGVAIMHIGLALAAFPAAMTIDFSQSRSMAGIISAMDISEKNTLMISYNSPFTMAVLPHIPDLFKQTYQIEQQRFGSFMVWTQDYWRNRKLSGDEVLRRVQAIFPRAHGKRIILLASQEFMPSSSFLFAFRLVARTSSDAVVSDEAYDIYELRAGNP